MISTSISAAAAMRKLGFWTNFGIMARDAPPRPITPTPKTRWLAAIYSLLSRHRRVWHLGVFDDYPSSKNLSRSARARGASDRYTLVAGRPADLGMVTLTTEARDVRKNPRRLTGVVYIGAY